MKIEITKQGHLWNGNECRGGETFEVDEPTGKSLIAAGIARDISGDDAPASKPNRSKTKGE